MTIFIVLFLINNRSTAQLDMGKYKVGFKYYLEYDFTRSFADSNDNLFFPRPIQINVWYPASGKVRKAMRVSDYCNLYSYQFNFSKKTKKEKDDNFTVWKGIFVSKGVKNTDSLLNQKTNAFSDAEFPEAKYPVVIYIPGAEGEAFENFLFCEYLASNGYVVVSCPSFGVYDNKTSVHSLGIETQVGDINFLYGYISKLSFADKSKVNLSGFSMGGLTTIIFNMRKLEKFNSIISIDGSIRTFYDMALQTPGFNPAAFNTPFLLFASNGDDWSDTLFFNRVKFADAYLAKVDSFTHLDFTSYNYFGNSKAKRKIYENFCRLTKVFLENPTNSFSELKKNAGDQIKLTFKVSEKIKLVSRNSFKKMIEAKGISESKQYYDQIRNIEPELHLFDEWEFTVLAFNYFNERKKPDEAIEIMKLVTDAYPESYKAIGLLGRLYEKNNDKTNAALYFSRALDKVKKIEDKTPPIIEDIDYYDGKVKINSQ